MAKFKKSQMQPKKVLPPWTATKVGINIKTERPYPELEELSNKKVTVNVDMTWEEVFRKYFGVTLAEPDKYSVNKKLSPIQHKLQDKISVFVSEFKYSKVSYNAYVTPVSVNTCEDVRQLMAPRPPSSAAIRSEHFSEIMEDENMDLAEQTRDTAVTSPIQSTPIPGISHIVPILIKTGISGDTNHSGLPSNLTKMVDVNMTWHEVFMTHFGVIVDPLCFNVQMKRWSSHRAQVVKHTLDEKVSVLMNEFKYSKSKPICTVHVVRFRRLVQPPKLTSVRDMNPPLPQRNCDTEEAPKKKPCKQTDISFVGARRTVHMGKDSYSRTFEGHPITSSSKLTHHGSRESSEPKFNGDEDGQSNITRFSSHSQRLDLLRNGIQNEDIKTPICNKIKSFHSNAQLLMCRNELEKLRETNNRRFMKWTTDAPITAGIFKELFGI